ncbi:uncharacterized protein DEA37_0012842 [Paragonimus westermani]|uniref:EF-hand domain-containing protein n=1 Tax=Paragonimus westermani TaxID=34504 RepID=A0A5J4NKA2_9TREM|nr:uncharacterized protein DEA37_0012842 [Paragonimus westermani]
MPRRLKKMKGKSEGTKKKRSGKTRKVKKSKLEIAVENYRKVPRRYQALLTAVDAWFSQHLEEFVSLLRLHISYSSDHASYDDFKAGLVDMKFPFNKLEIQMISLLYDSDRDGFINLDDLQTSLNELRLRELATSKQEDPKILISDRGWILGRFFCLSCLDIATHPFHFERLLPLNTYTEGVANVIRSHTALCTPTIDIYLSSTEQCEHKLQPNMMLTDQQLNGGNEWSPIEVAFYYRPASYLPSEWSPNSLPDFMSVAHDPLLWSEMTVEVARYEKQMQRHMSLLNIG